MQMKQTPEAALSETTLFASSVEFMEIFGLNLKMNRR